MTVFEITVTGKGIQNRCRKVSDIFATLKIDEFQITDQLKATVMEKIKREYKSWSDIKLTLRQSQDGNCYHINKPPFAYWLYDPSPTPEKIDEIKELIGKFKHPSPDDFTFIANHCGCCLRTVYDIARKKNRTIYDSWQPSMVLGGNFS